MKLTITYEYQEKRDGGLKEKTPLLIVLPIYNMSKGIFSIYLISNSKGLMRKFVD